MNAPDLYYSTDGEVFNTDDLTELDLVDGQTYWQGERVQFKSSELVSAGFAADIIERMQELLYDEFGDHAEDAMSISEESEAELLQIVRNWADQHAIVKCSKIKNVKEMTFHAAWEPDL
jgi:hypothetical protein